MNNHILSALGMAAMLTAPVVAWAQPSDTAGAATPSPSAQFTITVDYVTTPLANSLKESSRIAPGKEHDALLLAALLKGGAQDTQAPQVTTTAGVEGGLSVVSQTVPPLTSSIQAKPRLNKDGSITVTMKLRQESFSAKKLAGAILPSVDSTEVTETGTFQDGQTLMLDSMTDPSVTDQKGKPSAFLIFARVKSVAMPPPAAHSVHHS